jgi:uncharacterized protein
MKFLHGLTFVLLIIGGLNWGLYAINPTYELVHFLQTAWLIKLVYYLVGLSALYQIFSHKASCKHCEIKPSQPRMAP